MEQDKWFCVTFMEGAKTLKKTFQKMVEHQTVAAFMAGFTETDLTNVLVEKVEGYLDNPDQKDKKVPIDLPFDMMMTVVSSFGVSYLVVRCQKRAQTTDATPQQPVVPVFHISAFLFNNLPF